MRVTEPTALATYANSLSATTTNSNLNAALFSGGGECNEIEPEIKPYNGNDFGQSEEDLTTPSGRVISTIFSESGNLLLNSNNLRIFRSLSHSKFTFNLNGNDDIKSNFEVNEAQLKLELEEKNNLIFQHNKEFNEYFMNEEEDDVNDDDDDDDYSLEKRPISSCSSLDTKSPDESLMDDDDEFLPSSVSSSSNPPSISSSLRFSGTSNYPRGIINPNYPGFQHLAHTLSEHFVSHKYTNNQQSTQSLDTCDDSDISDYEMDLSFDSEAAEEMNNNRDHLGMTLQLNIPPLDNNAKPRTKYLPDESYFAALSELEDLSCDLETYLRKYETSADVKLQEMEREYNETNPYLSESESECSVGCPTPDILLKNDTIPKKPSVVKENRPDLLQNVEENVKSEDEIDQIKSKTGINFNEFKINPNTDEGSLGVTPVVGDIVGDFGREVEREFGLLVTGYNSIYDDLEENYMPQETQAHHLKVSTHKSDNIIPCDLVLEATVLAEEEGEKEIGEHNCTSPMSGKKLPTTNQNNSNIEILIRKNPSPTSPPSSFSKYKKYSFDDRQLPPNGINFSCQPPQRKLAENKENTKDSCVIENTNSTLSEPPLCQSQSQYRLRRANYSDRSTQILRAVNQRTTDTIRFAYACNSSGSQCGGVSGSTDKKNEKCTSVVAIVTPQKKDKYSDIRNNYGKTMNDNNNNNGSKLYSYDHMNNNSLEQGRKPAKDVPSTSAFDVYNIETALPDIDFEAIEAHLKKAKEEERKRRNDREEIRRRLAMEAEDDYFSKLVSSDKHRPARKPSFHSRIQNGKNLQICFMNEVSSDTESPPSSDSETCPKLSKRPQIITRHQENPYNARPLSVSVTDNFNQKTLTSSRHPNLSLGPTVIENKNDSDFFTKQARLQIEARMALAQAKDMAHMQMEIEKQKHCNSPITEIVQHSMAKVGAPITNDKRRLSRLMLTDLNIAQLQIIVNDFHSQIELFNTNLVQLLMERDDLHMGQDSMLVDIEDLTRYLGAKEQSTEVNSVDKVDSSKITNAKKPQTQSKLQRIANLVKK